MLISRKKCCSRVWFDGSERLVLVLYFRGVLVQYWVVFQPAKQSGKVTGVVTIVGWKSMSCCYVLSSELEAGMSVEYRVQSYVRISVHVCMDLGLFSCR